MGSAVRVNLAAQAGGALLAEGKVAVMLTYLGEETPCALNRATGVEATEPAILCDPWRAVQGLFPHKASTCRHRARASPRAFSADARDASSTSYHLRGAAKRLARRCPTAPTCRA